MAAVIEEKWTRDEILEAVTDVVRRRLDMSLPEFIAAVNAGRLETCEYAEVLALLNFLPADDPALCAA